MAPMAIMSFEARSALGLGRRSWMARAARTPPSNV